MSVLRILALAGCMTLAVNQTAQAGPILDLQTGGSTAPCGSGCPAATQTFGWKFTVNTEIIIDGLGLWDANSDGIGTTSLVGLFTDGGTLLRSVTITDSSTPVVSASANGLWLFEPVAGLTLSPGNYLIGATFDATLPTAQAEAPFTSIPEITLTGGAMAPGTGLAAPTGDFGFPIFGPTMSTTVPEPASFILLGIGLAALAVRLRGRRD